MNCAWKRLWGYELPYRPDSATAFDEADTDDGGSVDLDEFLAAGELRADARFAEVDGDVDGEITGDEIDAYQALRQERRGEARKTCVAERLDTEGDTETTLIYKTSISRRNDWQPSGCSPASDLSCSSKARSTARSTSSASASTSRPRVGRADLLPRPPRRLHPDQTRRQIYEEVDESPTRELLLQHRLASLINAMHLDHVLCQVHTNCRNVFHGRLSWSVGNIASPTLAL